MPRRATPSAPHALGPSGNLRGTIVPVPELPEATIASMWELFHRYYDATSREKFLVDLRKKRDVIVLRDTGDGSIQGFSTLMLCEKRVDGRTVVGIFSGDTIVDDVYWGQTELQRTFFRYLVTTKLRHPMATVYWFLISKGYRTYLLLTRNFPVHWPRHDRETPAWEARVMDALASDLFPDAWERDVGLLKFGGVEGKLKSHVAPIEPHMMAKEDIAFFARKNPGHLEGDELCCLGLVDAWLFLSWPPLVLGKIVARALDRRRRVAARRQVELSSKAPRSPEVTRLRAVPDPDVAPPRSAASATTARAAGRSRTG